MKIKKKANLNVLKHNKKKCHDKNIKLIYSLKINTNYFFLCFIEFGIIHFWGPSKGNFSNVHSIWR